ncbi:hypothetical protein [Liquorilactobacillus uvarum]|nr:hypothetical protein [Liquorilactobacillus uvarum]
MVKDDSWNNTYFWRYPNNVPLTYLLSLWLRLMHLINLTTNTELHILNFFFLDGFIVLMLVTLYQLNKRKSIVIGGFTFLVMSPFAYTYYLQIFYSDLPSMLVLLIIFRSLLLWNQKSKKQKIISGGILSLMILIGELIRPNLIVLLPAIAIVSIFLVLGKILKKSKLIIPIIIIIISFSLSFPITKIIYSASKYHKDSAYELPLTSWVMMGLNQKTNGTYSGSDISHEIKRTSLIVRQKYDKKRIMTRIKKLGPFGVLKQWIIKLGVLLNVGSIQSWYNGGFREAPNWYQKNATFFETLTSISYQIATIVLWLFVITFLWNWIPNLSKKKDPIILLVIITILGYLAFHTLIWETEERYGQIILPLILFLFGALSGHTPRPMIVKSRSLLMLITLAFLNLLSSANLISTLYPKPQVVVAQRSQLSTQYHAKRLLIKKGSVISEKLVFNYKANKFYIEIPASSNFKVELINTKSKHRYRLRPNGTAYDYQGKIIRGEYYIILKDKQNESQQIEVVQTRNYKLSPYSLMFNHHTMRYASLIYKGIYDPKR